MAEIRPFYDLSAELVSLARLSVVPVGAEESDGVSTVVSSWSVGTPLRVTGEIRLELDQAALLTELGLAEGQLVGSLVWTATGTRRSGHLPGTATGSGFLIDGTITEPVDGELRLRAVLTVAAGVSDGDPLAPVYPGTSVWEARQSFYLSGGGSRFPMVVVSFTESGLGPPSALWHVEIDLADFEADPSIALRLVINEDHPRREDLLLAEHTDLLAMLEWDIRRHVVEALLDDEDLVKLPEFASRTVGSFARQCLIVATGTSDLEHARRMRRSDRARFETRLRGGALALPT